MKLLLWLAIALVLVWAWRSNARRADTPARHDGSAKPGAGENMVSCAHCGVYLPASEAVAEAGMQFCSAQHRQLHFPS